MVVSPLLKAKGEERPWAFVGELGRRARISTALFVTRQSMCHLVIRVLRLRAGL